MGRQWYSYRDDLERPTQPVLLNFRSSKWLIGFTVFVAAFNVCEPRQPFSLSPLLLYPILSKG